MPGAVVNLPSYIPDGSFEVFVNGVPQKQGLDYRVDGRRLVFQRELRKEGRLGFWRWFLGAWGIGTYRQNDSVDIRYEAGGMPQLAEGLEIEPLSGAERHGASPS